MEYFRHPGQSATTSYDSNIALLSCCLMFLKNHEANFQLLTLIGVSDSLIEVRGSLLMNF